MDSTRQGTFEARQILYAQITGFWFCREAARSSGLPFFLLALFFVQVPESRQDMLADFLAALFKLYIDLNFVYMEINPIVVVGERITPLDMAAKIDETASFLCGPKWGEIDFPAPFGETNSMFRSL